MLALALPYHMHQQLIAEKLLIGKGALAPPRPAKLWFVRNQGS